MTLSRRWLATATLALIAAPLLPATALAQGAPLKFGVGMFQPGRDERFP